MASMAEAIQTQRRIVTELSLRFRKKRGPYAPDYPKTWDKMTVMGPEKGLSKARFQCDISAMPQHQRAADQTLIALPINKKLLAILDREMRKRGLNNRSEFVRKAIVEKLAASGVSVPPGLGSAPPRPGQNPH